jgi:hypothetical protein
LDFKAKFIAPEVRQDIEPEKEAERGAGGRQETEGDAAGGGVEAEEEGGEENAKRGTSISDLRLRYRPVDGSRSPVVGAKLREDGVADAVRWADIAHRFQQDVGLASAGQPSGAVAAYVDVGKQILPLARRDFVVNVPGY